jgi:hypothetical protein
MRAAPLRSAQTRYAALSAAKPMAITTATMTFKTVKLITLLPLLHFSIQMKLMLVAFL